MSTPADSHLARCLRVKELAERWRKSPRYVRDMIRRGQLEAIVVGGSVRITPEAIRAAEQRMAFAPATPARRRKQADGISPSVRALLEGAT